MTRGNIARVHPDGSGQSIYIHFGDPIENAGFLLEHYQTAAQVQALLDLGSVSSIGPIVGDRVDFYAGICDGTMRDVLCLAYHRDRNDPWERCRPQPFTGGLEGFRQAASALSEWLYAYTPDGWAACRAEPESRWDSIPNLVLDEATILLRSITEDIKTGQSGPSALERCVNYIAGLTDRPWQPPALRQLLAAASTR